MTRRLVLSYLVISVIVLIMLQIPLAVFYGQREEERFIANAERDAVVLGSFYQDALERGFSPDTLAADDYSARTQARVVLVNTAGISVFDTGSDQRRDFSTRPEVETALSGVRSSGIRYSSTLDTDLLFVAVPVASNGTVSGALRLTIDADEVTRRIERFWLGLAAIAALVLLSVAGLGWAIARSITKPIRQLEDGARRFSSGDLQPIRLDRDSPEEVVALGQSMDTMAARLDTLIGAQRAFVSDASHQLRTPLTALRLRIENLEADLTNPESMAEAGAAVDEIERLSTLVDDLLHLARAEQHPAVVVVDATQIITDRIDIWSAVATESQIDLGLTLPPETLEIQAIPRALEQLLDNTIDNAIKVTSPGGRIETGAMANQGSISISIADHGPGLSDADKKRALERFWRGDMTTPGTGLGLSIAKTLTEASGGNIRLSDTPGGGLTVTFEFRRSDGRQV